MTWVSGMVCNEELFFWCQKILGKIKSKSWVIGSSNNPNNTNRKKIIKNNKKKLKKKP
jgi:hypothetical protein